MAPELLKSDDAGGTSPKPSKESDVYAFGMMAYEVNTITITTQRLGTDNLSDFRTLPTVQAPQFGLLGHHGRHRWEAASATAPSISTRTQGLSVGHSPRVLGLDSQARPTIKGVRVFLKGGPLLPLKS